MKWYIIKKYFKSIFKASFDQKKELSKNSQGYSRGENTIWKWLVENRIEFEHQKKFVDCRDKKPLPFDFYLPAYNLCIEFQGSQHYDPGFYIRMKKSIKEGTIKYKLQKKHDRIKKQYCKIHNINFLEIKYNESIEDKLNKKIKKEI